MYATPQLTKGATMSDTLHPAIEGVIAERDHLRSLVHRLEEELEIITQEVQHLRAKEAQYSGKIED